jgi:hypothetical protein
VYEQRRVRFSNIDGLERQDLAIAGEVWLEEICRAPWVTRDVKKLANHFVRYMRDPRPERMLLHEIESEVQLGRDDMLKTLKQMRTYGAVEAFSCERTDLRVSLNLTFLQRLRVLEVTRRFGELCGARGHSPRPWLGNSSERWEPQPAAAEPDAEDPTTPGQEPAVGALVAAQ